MQDEDSENVQMW